jgi:hypothetical protein
VRAVAHCPASSLSDIRNRCPNITLDTTGGRVNALAGRAGRLGAPGACGGGPQIRTSPAIRLAASVTSAALAAMSSMTLGNNAVTHASLGPACEGTGAEIAVAW